ncbi:uncharacterized protein TNCV_2661851 [Trichonephila clavipes]|nr:uncharacterized protein TNCV_2661851 [Trichonephila clavipes]
MGHEDELTTEELQEILNEEHQETQRNVSPSEQEEDERGPMPTSAIKDLLKKWADVRAMVLEWHPNQADVSRGLAVLTAVPLGLGSNPEEDMEVCKCIVPSLHGSTLNSHRAASPLVRLVEVEERWEIPDHPRVFSL